MKLMLKKLSSLFIVSGLGAISAFASEADMMYAPGAAVFAAKGCETQRITIGGMVTTAYQFIDTNDEMEGTNEPNEFNNFYMKNIRLNVKAELGEGWNAYLSVDFAGKDRTIYFEDNTNLPTFCQNKNLCGVYGREIDRSCGCEDKLPLYIDQAYIQKIWLDATFRAGYQKVNWGAENVTPDEHIKTIERSVATNFFMNLGKHAYSGVPALAYTGVPGVSGPSCGTANALDVICSQCNLSQPCVQGACSDNRANDYRWVGQAFGDRHVGIFVAGQWCAFHYSGAIVNGYQGLCRNSDAFNNSLGYFASLAFEFGVDEIDILLGANVGYKPKGANYKASKSCHVFGFNPYVFANWKQLSFMGEFFYGNVKHGSVKLVNNPTGCLCTPGVCDVTPPGSNVRAAADTCGQISYEAQTGGGNSPAPEHQNASPWGFNAILSYMCNDTWEFVTRFSFVNSDEMGMNIVNTFGCAPDDGILNTPAGSKDGCKQSNCATAVPGRPTYVASDQLFEKVVAGYLGVNYYCMNGAIKFSLGLEQAKFKNRLSGSIEDGTAIFDHDKIISSNSGCRSKNTSSDSTNLSNSKGVKVNAVRAQIQFLF